MLISRIKINGRSRRDLGDIAALAASINHLGLLHPIVVDEKGLLIAGQRRLEACKSLGWREVPTTTVRTIDDALKILEAERDENTERKPYTPTEAHALAKRLEPFERAAAKSRQGKRPDKHPEKFTGSSNGNASDKIASAVGLSRPTLRKIDKVVRLAEQNPARYGEFVKKLDDTGKVDKVFKEATKKKAEELGPIPAEAAKKAPAVRWAHMIHALSRYINSTRYNGGIEALTAKWGDGTSKYVQELKYIINELQTWVDILEGRTNGRRDVDGTVSRST